VYTRLKRVWEAHGEERAVLEANGTVEHVEVVVVVVVARG
jgi:hypothetical protein